MNTSFHFMFQEAFRAFQAGDLMKAEGVLKHLLQSISNNFDVLHLLAIVCAGQGKHLEALGHYKKAIKINPNDSLALSNFGSSLNVLGQNQEALAVFQKALKINPNYFECWYNAGNVLCSMGRYDEAIPCYEQSVKLNPEYIQAHINQGKALFDLKRYSESLNSYDKALNLKPDYAEAYSNKGDALSDLRRYDEAIAHYDKALNLRPDYAEAYFNKGNALSDLKRYDEALAHYDKALNLKPDVDWIYGALVHTKMKMCNWLGLADFLGNISKGVMANKKVAHPFPLLALIDDTLIHKKSSEIFIRNKFPSNDALSSIMKCPKNQKIRVGYFSADFHNHATGYLMAELFELHDKNQFELFGFSFGPIMNDAMRQRLEKSFDQFIEVSEKSDMEIARLSRDLDIDIAIDLKGFTRDSRTGIFGYRAAPIQINYLGYPGTMGAEYIDYIIADTTLIPPESQECYSEKVVYLPDSYQVNDRKRLIAARQFTRQDLGLPENGFVFCCFNNNYKIMPTTFDGWMRILKAVEGSILWLFQDNPWVVENLKKEVDKRGINVERLVFAEQMPLSEHLARHRQADLFLDTLPCNAHTTASDALWAGVPVLTLMGQSFASRVAASLLNAINLPELITGTQEEYETLAIELAKNPQKLAAIKQKLSNSRLNAPLFDTPHFTKNLEAAYIKMYEKYKADLPPDHIYII